MSYEDVRKKRRQALQRLIPHLSKHVFTFIRTRSICTQLCFNLLELSICLPAFIAKLNYCRSAGLFIQSLWTYSEVENASISSLAPK